jgi:hypothetical protein
MAYTVDAAFNTFYEQINLSGDHRETANKRRDWIVEQLKKKFEVLDSFGTGSIPKFTALKGHADLDVMVVLHYGKHIKDKLPSTVLQNVRDALAGYRTGVRSNGQAVTLGYDTWPNVDIVPVSRTDDANGNVTQYNVPNSNTEQWMASRPKKHATTIEGRSTDCGQNFRRIIKMIKHWNRIHSEYLTSYHIEVLALNIFHTNLDDLPWNIHLFFDNAVNLVKSSLWYEVNYADAYLTTTARAEAVKRLEAASAKSLTAWYATHGSNNEHQTAIATWKQIFGDKFPAYG